MEGILMSMIAFPPTGWTQNLIPGAGPLCHECQPSASAKDLKAPKEKKS